MRCESVRSPQARCPKRPTHKTPLVGSRWLKRIRDNPSTRSCFRRWCIRKFSASRLELEARPERADKSASVSGLLSRWPRLVPRGSALARLPFRARILHHVYWWDERMDTKFPAAAMSLRVVCIWQRGGGASRSSPFPASACAHGRTPVFSASSADCDADQ